MNTELTANISSDILKMELVTDALCQGIPNAPDLDGDTAPEFFADARRKISKLTVDIDNLLVVAGRFRRIRSVHEQVPTRQSRNVAAILSWPTKRNWSKKPLDIYP